MGQKKYTFHEIQCETFKLCLIHVRKMMKMVSRPAHVPIEALNEHFEHFWAFSTVFALSLLLKRTFFCLIVYMCALMYNLDRY